MKKIKNVLYVTNKNAYLFLDGENIVVQYDSGEKKRFPLLLFEAIYIFSYRGMSPELMRKCIEMNIYVAFFGANNQFYARVIGEQNGNVLLRREQYRMADDLPQKQSLAQKFICSKIYNERQLINRFRRNHSMIVDTEVFMEKSDRLKAYYLKSMESSNAEELRSIEGLAAKDYFSIFGKMILNQNFSFHGRNRRPALDEVNALLSFAYSMTTSLCVSALEGVGLDSYVGMLHTDRSGRNSLALDLVEEFRSPMAERFVLKAINNRMLSTDDFDKRESGAVNLSENGRSKFLKAWNEMKNESLSHPFLDEKIVWGQLPWAQSLLLARFIRGDLDDYPPFFWRP